MNNSKNTYVCITLSTNIMKRFTLLLIFSAFISLVWGQSVNEVHLKDGSINKGKIDRHRGNLYWEDTDCKLTGEEYATILDENLYSTFKSAHEQYNAGRVFMTLGFVSAGVAVTSLMLFAETRGYDINGNYHVEPGYVDLFVLSTCVANVGICFGCIFKGAGKGRLEWVKDTYNSGGVQTNNRDNQQERLRGGRQTFYSSTLFLNPNILMTAKNEIGFGATLSLTF